VVWAFQECKKRMSRTFETLSEHKIYGEGQQSKFPIPGVRDPYPRLTFIRILYSDGESKDRLREGYELFSIDRNPNNPVESGRNYSTTAPQIKYLKRLFC
jgi:hypothetical protein